MHMNKRRFLFRAVAAAFGAIALHAAAAQAVIVRTAVAYRPVPPVARAAVTTDAVLGTAAVVGSVVASLPPSCVTTMIGNVAYQQCGSTWYRPQYAGSQVTYVFVNPRRYPRRRRGPPTEVRSAPTAWATCRSRRACCWAGPASPACRRADRTRGRRGAGGARAAQRAGTS